MFRSDSSIVRYETFPPSHICASTGQPGVKRPGKGLTRRSSRTHPAAEESRMRVAGERSDG